MKIAPTISILLALLMIGVASASDFDTLISDCDDCHGKDGISTDDDIPIIAGQSYIVLEDALIAFSADEQPCKESEYRHGDTSRAAITMCSIAAELSDEDIEALSEHYENLSFVAAEQGFDSALADKGATIHERNCEKCHSEGGSLADDDAGILAGQWTPYLRSAFDQYISGERSMSKKMAEKMERVKPEDFDALLHFYASGSQ
ncbi:MAG: cytochrome c-553 [Gammaproteobacteria bacterium]|nr:cytochrome c-553 [Gammaproteobacteria bacterium]